ncbi:MAG TPA: hypothetical protein VGR07_15610 [Thermoanaerobaculia bacterium]|jgi:hypothetical protein|nr:hypothetical protein [Thermoanaerobaculia bacterium]
MADRWRTALTAVLALLLLAAAPPRRPGERARAGSLAAELGAVKSHQLYLVLDPRAPALDLKVDGVLLRRFAVESALFGRSRLAAGDYAFPAYAYTLVSQLDEPERPKIPIQAPATEPAAAPEPGAKPGFDPHHANPAVSPAAEDLLARAPTHFRLRFDPALDVSILGEAGVANLPGRLWRARHRLIEGWEALLLRLRGQTVPPRVVLYLTPQDARRLFLALLPRIRLVLQAPEPAG